MRLYGLPANKLFIVALVASACIHFFISQFVVIGFSSMKESPKSSMVFHGSFLKSFDASGLTEAGESLPLLPNFHWKDMGDVPYERAQISKPQSQETRSILIKEIEKSAFLSTSEEPAQPLNPADLGIEEGPRPYEPLRFQSK